MYDKRFIAAANESMEDNLKRNESTVLASYALIGAILLFGVVGYLLDAWLDTTPWLLVLGLATGLGGGLAGLVGVMRKR